MIMIIILLIIIILVLINISISNSISVSIDVVSQLVITWLHYKIDLNINIAPVLILQKYQNTEINIQQRYKCSKMCKYTLNVKMVNGVPFSRLAQSA